MDILYILLGGKDAKSVDGMSPAMFVTYGSAKNDGTESVPWPADSSNSPPPISYLVNRARQNAWKTAAEPILLRYKANSRWEKLLEDNLQFFAQIDLGKFDLSNTVTDGNQDDALIARELKHIARKIVERKTAFVFPESWPDNIAGVATELVRLMVKELWVYLREVPVEKELPWTFLSMNTDSGSGGALGEFIRALHSEMLADKNGVDIVAWSQKSGAILLSGPTGSGKSYAARLLANHRKYKSRRLVEVNLAAVAEELLESRMRGFVAGAFTGADKGGRAGWFEEAHEGVLFLDEFQSVSPVTQVQLLDLINAVSDDIQIARIGKDHERTRFNVKVILAINEDINTLLREKRLRKDIYYRVRFVEAFPSLKERLDHDMEHRYLRGLLASYRWKSLRTIEQLCRLEGGWRDMVPTFFPMFSLDALSELTGQEWEGNFREMERVAFDLYYGCDYQQQSMSIDRSRVVEVMKSWCVPVPTGNAADGMNDAERRKLNDIQKTLRDSGFVIAKVLKNQLYYRSRPPLKRYLRNHIEKLDADIRGDFRMARFLGLKEN
jgi:hypothetical protein